MIAAIAFLLLAGPARCTGAADCRACSSCKYCAHCAKEGGTCGVCAMSFPKPAKAPSGRQEEPQDRKEDILARFMARKERWPVKVAADDDRAEIRSAVVRTTVAALVGKERPAGRLPRNNRAGDVERTAFQVDADIIAYKAEKDDLDYHVVIQDHGQPNGPTMVVELSSPLVTPASGRYRGPMTKAREAFTAAFDIRGSFKTTNRRALITGIGFFDYLHGQRGMALNGIELHPVVGLELKG